jgi:hypothetical protein
MTQSLAKNVVVVRPARLAKLATPPKTAVTRASIKFAHRRGPAQTVVDAKAAASVNAAKANDLAQAARLVLRGQLIAYYIALKGKLALYAA